MGWYSIDAVDTAIKRTKKALIEPFDFWKWIKLGIIIFFIGSTGFPNFPGGYNQPYDDKKIEGASNEEMIKEINLFWDRYKTYIMIGIAAIVFFIILFVLLSSIMEFVLIESLVTNKVTIRANFRKYLRSGFNLFIIQLILLMAFLSLFILAMMPILQKFLESPANITPGMILMGILWFFVVIMILALVGGIIHSLIGLSIPLAMYQEIGITAALKEILGKFKMDWQQILVYWVVRIVLGLVVGIALGIAALILLIIILIPIVICGVILYLMVSGLGIDNPVSWILIIPFSLFAALILITFLLMISVPGAVFMKYHQLTFLKAWYPEINIRFFDAIDNVGSDY